MSISKRPNGSFAVHVYDSTIGRKRYAGQRDTQQAARLLEAQKTVEYAQQAPRRSGRDWTVAGWRVHWLQEHHGPNTKRPTPTTKMHNEQMTRRYHAANGGRKLRTVTRDEAQAWAKKRPHEAKSLAAMFNDAVDAGHLTINPWARLGIQRSPGRRDIDPLTIDEIDTLQQLSIELLGIYGQPFADFIACAAWVGWRPGEACGLERTEVDLRRGMAHIAWQRRVSGERVPHTKTHLDRWVVLADPAVEALSRRLRESDRREVFLTPGGKPLRPDSIRFYWRPVRAAFVASLPADHWLPRRLRKDPGDHLDPYENRHFCGSYLADQGLTAREIAEHLGNTPAVCETYLHSHRDNVRDRIRAAFGANLRELPGRRDTGEWRAMGEDR